MDWSLLIKQAEALLGSERDFIANAANLSALIYSNVGDLNWAGFYFLRSEDELVLGPFQGKVACVRIKVGRGVCGSAVERAESIVVADVHEFPGHIACDCASESEVVVPIIVGGKVIGVLDIDSPQKGRFADADRDGFEKLVKVFISCTDIPQLF
ncbi:MAG: GAF domain-containing protein [Lentisphaeria bacterium]